ncbi:MAG: cbb3-type cytochrome c oxidase subunit 3 [Pseudomonadales bacterium]
MTATLFSLISLTLGFAALLYWVLKPSNRGRWEEASQLPFSAAETGERDRD